VDAEGAPAKLGVLLKDVTTACEDLTSALELAAELDRFLAPENLDQVAKWVAMDGSLRFAFRLEGSTLVDGLTENRLSLDPVWSIPQWLGLALMKATLRASA